MSWSTLEKRVARAFPLEIEVTGQNQFFFISNLWGLDQKDSRLLKLADELTKRTGYKSIVTSGYTGVETRPEEPSDSVCAQGTTIAFYEPRSIARVTGKFASAGRMQQVIKTALNDPALWEKMTSEYNVASIKLGDEVYSFANGKVIQTKAEAERPNKAPKVSAERHYVA